MTQIGAADAARNNAAWCDAVCRVHGHPGEFSDSHWLNRAPAPPRYPNLVTLDPAVGPAMAAVRELEQAPPSASWAVKDSFGVLPLEKAGFRLLFGAEWIHRPAQSPRRPTPGAGCLRIQTESALAGWEAAWGESAGEPRVFLPSLLRRREVAILAALGPDGAFRAGVIANCTENAVGLSNLFALGKEGDLLLAVCIDAASDAFPDLPLLGYEAGQTLAASPALGFSSLGPLQVWIKDG